MLLDDVASHRDGPKSSRGAGIPRMEWLVAQGNQNPAAKARTTELVPLRINSSQTLTQHEQARSMTRSCSVVLKT